MRDGHERVIERCASSTQQLICKTKEKKRVCSTHLWLLFEQVHQDDGDLDGAADGRLLKEQLDGIHDGEDVEDNLLLSVDGKGLGEEVVQGLVHKDGRLHGYVEGVAAVDGCALVQRRIG